MAKLPALVSALDLSSDRDRSTIEHIARVVREAGLIPTTKRGPGAADMGVREAANLLIGVAAADSPRVAPETIASLRDMARLDEEDSTGLKMPHLDLRPRSFAPIREAHNFGEALERLIAAGGQISSLGLEMVRALSTAEQFEFLKGKPEIARLALKYPLRVEITPSRRAATIELPCVNGGKFVFDRIHFIGRDEADRGIDAFRHVRIKIRVEIGLVPIFKLWAALNGRPDASGPTELGL